MVVNIPVMQTETDNDNHVDWGCVIITLVSLLTSLL